MTEIWVDVSFDSAHLLPNVPKGHKCGRLHGHTYRVRLYVGGEVNEHTGWIVDYADIKEAWQPVHDQLDHRYLNDLLGLDNPTCELIAAWIWGKLAWRLPGLSRIEIQETCTAGCVYTGP